MYDSLLNRPTSSGENSNCDSQLAKIGLINSLKNNGYNFILNQVFKNELFVNDSIDSNKKIFDDLIDIKYHTSWKLGEWNFANETKSSRELFDDKSASINFNKSIFYILDSIKKSTIDQSSFLFDIKSLINFLVKNSNNSLLEKLINSDSQKHKLNKIMSGLSYLEEIKRFSFLFDPNRQIDFEEFFQNSTLNLSHLNNRANKIDDFFLFDDLVCLKIELNKLILNMNDERFIQHEPKIRESLTNLYENLIDNAVVYKKFQACFYNPLNSFYDGSFYDTLLSKFFNFFFKFKDCPNLFERNEKIFKHW
jgi:hypothetical protein